MAVDQHPVGIRMPADLKKKVQAAAKTAKRSVNAEVCRRLELSFDPLPVPAVGEPAAKYTAMPAADLSLTERQQQALTVLLTEEHIRAPAETIDDQLWVDCMSLVVDCVRASRAEITPAQFSALVAEVYEEAQRCNGTPPPTGKVVTLIDDIAA